MAYNLKAEAYTYDFTSIILMEPAGIPLKTMDELFDVYSTGVGEGVSGHNILNAPKATGRELEGIEKMRKIRHPRCFGKIKYKRRCFIIIFFHIFLYFTRYCGKYR